MPTNKPRFTFQISEDIAQRIEAAAKAERRTTANFLAYHIEQLFSSNIVKESPAPLAVAPAAIPAPALAAGAGIKPPRYHIARK